MPPRFLLADIPWPHLQCVCADLLSRSLEIADDRKIVCRCLSAVLLVR
jgi:hypothetical protein